jgi:hypothetical protein
VRSGAERSETRRINVFNGLFREASFGTGGGLYASAMLFVLGQEQAKVSANKLANFKIIEFVGTHSDAQPQGYQCMFTWSRIIGHFQSLDGGNTSQTFLAQSSEQ